ncbi:MAG TPA: PA-phosphatase [Brevundimonas sp.]|nr:PA-phosphatase [Brevundimonas sp.]
MSILAASLPAPPAPGDVAQDRDEALSAELRALEDTDRWWMATAHAELRPPYAAQHFDCVLGTRLAGAPRPALNRLMARLLADSQKLTLEVTARSPRLRPIADPDRRACQRVDEATRASRNGYPAGGAVTGAAYGELFAALAPDRAEAARRMGAEIGLSRAICATNWPSDVAAGQALGLALYQQAAADPDFAAELEAARAEIIAARAEGLTSPACASERLALAQTEAYAGRGEASAP